MFAEIGEILFKFVLAAGRRERDYGYGLKLSATSAGGYDLSAVSNSWRSVVVDQLVYTFDFF